MAVRMRAVAVVAASVGSWAAGTGAATHMPSPRLPLPIESNLGQAPEGIAYVARAGGVTIGFDRQGLLVVGAGEAGCDPDPVRVRFAGGRRTVAPRADGRLPGTVSYFRGADPSRWVSGAPTWTRVVYDQVYPGIDVSVSGAGGALEIEYHVAPGARPESIALAAGDTALEVEPGGDALLAMPGGVLRLRRPFAFQGEGAGRQPVAARYVAASERELRVEVGAFDPDRELIVDPVLSYASYFGGSSQDSLRDMALDESGNVYLVGLTQSPDFPRVGPPGIPGARSDGFVSKLDPSGTSLVYSVVFGGTSYDGFDWLDVDAIGRVHLVGHTQSDDFPLVRPIRSTLLGSYDIVVAVLDATGSTLEFSTLLGGSGGDIVGAAKLDSSGRMVIAGYTSSDDYPVVAPLQATRAGRDDGFVTVIDTTAGNIVWSTLLGGEWNDFFSALAIGADDSVLVVGTTSSATYPTVAALQPSRSGLGDALVTRFASDGSRLIFSTYLGGSDGENGQVVIRDSTGAWVIAGTTRSADFPRVGPQPLPGPGRRWDNFVLRLSAAGDSIERSVVGGASEGDYIVGLAEDPLGDLFALMVVESSGLPLVRELYGPSPGLPMLHDYYVLALNPTWSAIYYATYLRGSDVEGDWFRGAVDPQGTLYVSGSSSSADFPVVAPFQGSYGGLEDGVLARIGCVVPPAADNALFAVRADVGATLALRMAPVPETSYFELYEDVAKDGPFATPTGRAPDGLVGLDLPMPAPALVFYRVASANPCGEGPR